SALIDHEIVRRAPDIRFTLIPAPEVDDDGLVPGKLGGRLLSWYKISIVQKLLHDWKSMAPGSKPCKYIAWIEDDAFLSQPDVDYAASFASLPLWVRPQYEPPSMSTPAEPSPTGVSSADATTVRATSLTEVAMAAAVERVVPGILEANEGRCASKLGNCRFNVGVLLFNAEHPKLPELLEDWWRAPLTGVCNPSMATSRGAEQACLDALIEWNATTRAQYRHVVGEADLLTINTPAGRLMKASPEAQLKSQPATASSAEMETARDVSARLANLSRANLLKSHPESQPATLQASARSQTMSLPSVAPSARPN
ncbi:hypothetical protein Ctob_015813, partial [Chrysochromulina tobinii]